MSGDDPRTFEEVRDQYQPVWLVVLGVAFVVLGGLSAVFELPWFVSAAFVVGGLYIAVLGRYLRRLLGGKSPED